MYYKCNKCVMKYETKKVKSETINALENTKVKEFWCL